MATRVPTSVGIKNAHGYGRQWSGLLNGDDGTPVELHEFSDRSIQVTGTFGAAGNVKIEGSNDGTNYVVLTDPQGNALDVAAAKIEAVSEMTRFIRPRVSAGDGTTSLVVTLFAAGRP